MKLNNLSDLDDELFNEIAQSFDTPNLIELLGMAKNCIVEVLDSGLPLPEVYMGCQLNIAIRYNKLRKLKRAKKKT